MKKCFKCGIKKDISEFYRHSQMGDGHLNKCKECNKKDVQKNYRANLEYYKEYDRQRAQLPHRKERVAEYQRSYPEKKKEYITRYRKKYPDKHKAHNIISNALRDGKILKSKCWCGSEYVHAHHDDYSKPLDIKWVCPKHHTEIHQGKLFV